MNAYTSIHKIILNTWAILTIAACSGSKIPEPLPASKPAASGGTYIEWDQETRTRISGGGMVRYAGYARIIQLPDKSLLGVYEADGSIVSVKSNDLGATWSAPNLIAARTDGSNMSVPELLQLSNKTIIAFYNGRPYQISPGRKFNIRMKQSTDGGATWTDEKVLYEAGYQFENGCWEPAAIQLPNGEIQLYFANEGPYTQSDEQNISLLRSTDNGGTWTSNPSIVSFRPGKRDGMPVPLLLQNGKDIVVAIEDNADNAFKPYILKNTLQQNWAQPITGDSPQRSYALLEPLRPEIYAGAPYIRQLSTGETILSYQGTEGRTNKMDFADMKVVVGNEQATEFKNKSVPFVIPANKSCLWNSLTILHDDTVIAVTSTNAYADHTEVWMIKGKVIRDSHHSSLNK
ncbi:glycoside hydrolase [Sphingobacterium sp. InxBP1]|uniref:sialidase family protein n=1 Tax=Sphingobacterium sp. InxBP1 TaxID=2870328 RepID=UPI002243215E|nr:sialidase family protein [Sphingobacterium sp. InxBP1]MCW8313417.1 glycoside hydrolase [Sphingobacterium sp. InxBP1]